MQKVSSFFANLRVSPPKTQTSFVDDYADDDALEMDDDPVVISDDLVVLARSMAREVPMNSIKFRKKIGEGAYSLVWDARLDDEKVAAKVIKRSKKSGVVAFVREVTALSMCAKNPHVVQLIGACFSPELIVITERMDCSLYELLHQRNVRFTEFACLDHFLALADGLRQLHAINIVHRDFSSQNILWDGFRFKIADFGIAREKAEKGNVRWSPIGNPRWRAPEVTLMEMYNKRVDVFGFGTVMWEMLTAKPPFEDIEDGKEVARLVASGRRLPIPLNIGEGLKSLLASCWAQDPAQRPSSSEVVKILEKIVRGSTGNVITKKNSFTQGEGLQPPSTAGEAGRKDNRRVSDEEAEQKHWSGNDALRKVRKKGTSAEREMVPFPGVRLRTSDCDSPLLQKIKQEPAKPLRLETVLVSGTVVMEWKGTEFTLSPGDQVKVFSFVGVGMARGFVVGKGQETFPLNCTSLHYFAVPNLLGVFKVKQVFTGLEGTSELTLDVGDNIALIEARPTGWGLGFLGMHRGVFPLFKGEVEWVNGAKMAHAIPSLPDPFFPLASNFLVRTIAQRRYVAQSSVEISFDESDQVLVTGKEGRDFLRVQRVLTGRVGLAPLSCFADSVSIIVDEALTALARQAPPAKAKTKLRGKRSSSGAQIAQVSLIIVEKVSTSSVITNDSDVSEMSDMSEGSSDAAIVQHLFVAPQQPAVALPRESSNNNDNNNDSSNNNNSNNP